MNQLVVKTAGELAKHSELLSQYIRQDAFKDDIRPYLTQLAAKTPALQAFDFIEFVQKCALTGADPRRNQAYLIPRQQNAKYKDEATGRWIDNWITVATTVFAYQFFIAKAQEQGDFEGYEVKTVSDTYFNPFTGNQFKTLCSLCTVKRKGRDPFTYRAWLPEFVKLKDGAPVDSWATKPYLMLEKCATANAFRLAWPEAMSGMYCSEEMVGENSKEVVDASRAEAVHKVMVPEVIDKVKEEAKANGHPVEPLQTQPVTAPAAEVIDVQPDDAPLDAEPAPAPQAPPPQEPPKKDEPMAGKQTKAVLFSGLKYMADQKKLNLDAALTKLQGVRLTEPLAQSLIAAIKAGDVSWFTQH